MRILHCIIFLRSTGCPPRSDTPLTISSFAKTVPRFGHQLTSVSAKYVSLYFNNTSCFSLSEKASHCEAVKDSTSSSHTAFTFAFPSEEKIVTKSSIPRALSESTSYQLSKSCKKIHWVHL